MGPRTSFRRLGAIAERRPKLVTAVGLALVAEGGRVVWGLATGGPVALLGHSGLTTFDGVIDRPWLTIYVAWVTLAGIVVLSLVRRATRRRAIGGAVARNRALPIRGASAGPGAERPSSLGAERPSPLGAKRPSTPVIERMGRAKDPRAR